ncbi:dihydroorotase [Tanticharoenia sakaeratensis]|uniref:Dihydroorotase n=1 Tax=Tanticharoenia sakaeratensis NBRC 103193 TaxID=1231623 RepID=A0A0D6MHE1_9PROT|nr:dihydroorotase [Tanticharoenia sakaeratensis]GAN52916.1 dihydroorotase [Tanticharoenia sakaeratensis NBRC 103193]GBQ18188.1 dihydroorotase [Tanticharoenia sakaeratensis NBRC 103193]
MTTTVIHNVRLLDPSCDLDRTGHLLLRDGLIAGLGADGDVLPDDAERIDGEGCVLSPGLVDMRVAIGEPGSEYRETIASAARAAVAGGVTTMAVLPNAVPAIDDPALVRLLRARGDETGMVTIHPYGALTKGCAGQAMAELGLLQEAGAIGFTDGIRAIADTKQMRNLLSYARGIGATVVQHPEDPSLASGGCATAGALATRFGLPQIPAAAEAILIARDLRLAELTGARLHFGHVSTAEGIGLIREAKARGSAVTCDTAPPYFALNETAIVDFRTYAKLSPPLRTEADRIGVIEGLADGTIDAIASDHAPSDADDKRLPFAQARAGGTGLATLLGVTMSLVHAGSLSLSRAMALLTAEPARLLGIEAGSLKIGGRADLCLFAPDEAWQVEAGALPGRAQNTPFDGAVLRGRVRGTWKNGRQVFAA